MRRGKPENRIIPPDIRHNSVAVQTLVQHMMVRGKKSTATRIMYDTLDIIADKTGKNPMETFDMALKNVGPLMEVRPRRVGGATYQVPMEVPGDRRLTLSIRWILQAARARSGKSFSTNSQVSWWMRPPIRERPFANAKKPTRWQRPTAPSRTIACRFESQTGL
jgi:small subunit ribosomal protein S7